MIELDSQFKVPEPSQNVQGARDKRPTPTLSQCVTLFDSETPLVTPKVAEVAGTSVRRSQRVGANPPVYYHDGADIVVTEADSILELATDSTQVPPADSTLM